jgi:two-component system response regulator RegX3
MSGDASSVERLSGVGPKVLVVEDEPAYAESIQVGLTREGFEVFLAADGAAALEQFDRVSPDVVLLDLMLPKISGTQVCRELRQKSRTPIIVVTALTSEIDAVVSLELGADDYVTKPFRLRELAARIRAVLRRASAVPPPTRDTVLAHGTLRLDPATREMKVADSPVALTRKEFDLLEVLIRGAGRVQPRVRLLEEVWGDDYYGDSKTLDVHIKRLRDKLGQAVTITTFRGVGYRLEQIIPERAGDDAINVAEEVRSLAATPTQHLPPPGD